MNKHNKIQANDTLQLKVNNFQLYFNLSVLLMLIALAIPTTFFSQKSHESKIKYGAAAESYVSGNGHGIMYSGLLNISKKKQLFSFGPCIQRRNMKLGGGKFSYAYMLIGAECKPKTLNDLEFELNDSLESEYSDGIVADLKNGVYNERIELHFFSFVQYLNNLSLGYSDQRMENYVSGIENQNWNKVKLSTVDLGVGVQLRIKVAKQLVLKNFMSFSFYYHTKYVNGMHHERYTPTLTLGTAIELSHFY